MRKYLLLLSMIGCVMAQAKQITPQEALAKALGTLQTSGAKGMKLSTMELQATEMSEDETPLCYIFNNSAGGYIITSADDRARILLGSVSDCTYEESMQIPAFRDWMQGCREALTWLSQQPEASTAKKASATNTELKEAVEPLLGDIKWNQAPIFNNMCPNDKTTGHLSVTGCPATAASQVMAYWKWPKQGVGEHTNSNYTSQHYDFSKSTYDWDNMLPDYNDTTNITQEQKDAVAKLMAEVGCALNTLYKESSSGTTTGQMFIALPKYFRYSKSMKKCLREFYSSAEWDELLKNELSNGRPILMEAYTNVLQGHAFVIDGYNSNDLFHVNWGWGGKSNDYFCIDIMEPASQGIGGSVGGYSVSQNVYIGIQPDTTQVASTQNFHTIGIIKYIEENDAVCVKVSNEIAEPFYGTVSLQLLDESGNIVAKQDYDYSSDPIYGLRIDTLYFNNISKNVIKEGYKVRPVYYNTGSTEAIAIPSAQYLDNELSYADGKWQPANVTMPEVTNIETVLAYTSNIPKLKVTFRNPETNTKEIISAVNCVISQKGTAYCQGIGYLFLKPGETQDVEFQCKTGVDGNTSIQTLSSNYKNLKAGICGIKIEGLCNYQHPDHYDEYTIHVDSFTMIANARIKIETKIEVNPGIEGMSTPTYNIGDSIKANVTVYNKGGYYEGICKAYIADLTNRVVLAFFGQTVSFFPGDSLNIELATLAPNAPGSYQVVVYCPKQLNMLYIEVVSPTGISDVRGSENNGEDTVRKFISDGKMIIRKNGRQYNVAGQRIK